MNLIEEDKTTTCCEDLEDYIKTLLFAGGNLNSHIIKSHLRRYNTLEMVSYCFCNDTLIIKFSDKSKNFIKCTWDLQFYYNSMRGNIPQDKREKLLYILNKT